MTVVEVVILRRRAGGAQVDRTERDRLTRGVLALLNNVGTAGNQDRVLEEIVGGAVLLEDDDYMLDDGDHGEAQ